MSETGFIAACIPLLARTFLVHGEDEVMRQFGALLENMQMEMPALGQLYEL